jgi:uncharacterized membrane protein
MALLVWLACTSAKESAGAGTTGGASICDDAALVTYENFGQGFMTENCQACHASTAPDRYDAPEEVFFDTKADAWYWRDRILARSAGDDASMPPNGGVDEDDRTRLRWWLECSPEGS